MIAIIDYGMGNLRSVQKALEKVGAETVITSDKRKIEAADKVVLPGVGAIRPAIDRLKELGLVETIKMVVKNGKPFLGICLGLQLLFEKSFEGGEVAALGILPGSVTIFDGRGLKVPHMGWNTIKKTENVRLSLLNGISNEDYFYFVHSYFPVPEDQKLIA